MERKRVSYSKQMKERAKELGKHLVTIDIPGLTYQGYCTKEECQDLEKLICNWWKKDSAKKRLNKSIEQGPAA